MSATSSIEQSPAFDSAARTTPGPDTPTFNTQSGSPGPWNAPAIKGLSSGALQNTTSFALPMQSRSAVSSAVCLTMPPIMRTASILMPLLVAPILTEEQTCSVRESASGIERISSKSPAANPLCTSAVYPPMKFTPTAWAAFSSVRAYSTGSPPLAAASIAMGVTDIRLLMMGIPYFFSISSPVFTRSRAREVILS